MIIFLLWLALGGLIVGAVARLLLPGPDMIGIPGTILVGIGGSVLGGWVGRLFLGTYGGFIGFLLGVLCAMLILYVLRRSRAA